MKMSEKFARSGFAKFINTPAGRVVRIIAGLILIGWGYAAGGTGGIIVIVIGLVPLIAGVFNLCIIRALLGGPIKG